MAHHDDDCPDRFPALPTYEYCRTCHQKTCEKCFGVRLPSGVYCGTCGRAALESHNLGILLGLLAANPETAAKEVLVKYEAAKLWWPVR
jgi:hypothetical protein